MVLALPHDSMVIVLYVGPALLCTPELTFSKGSVFFRHVMPITIKAKTLTKNNKTIHAFPDPHFPLLPLSFTLIECSRNTPGMFCLNCFCICSFFSLDCVSSSIHMAHSLTLLQFCLLVRMSWLLRPSYYSKYSRFYPSSLHYISPSFLLSPFFSQSNVLHISLICLLYSQFLP